MYCWDGLENMGLTWDCPKPTWHYYPNHPFHPTIGMDWTTWHMYQVYMTLLIPYWIPSQYIVRMDQQLGIIPSLSDTVNPSHPNVLLGWIGQLGIIPSLPDTVNPNCPSHPNVPLGWMDNLGLSHLPDTVNVSPNCASHPNVPLG